MKMVSNYFHARDLFAIAVRASKATNPEADGPIISIMFSVNALEAFINESGALADCVPTSKKQPIVEGYGQVMEELEQRKEGLILKYHFAFLVFSGATWKSDDPLLSDLKLLVALRNEIMRLLILRATRGKHRSFQANLIRSDQSSSIQNSSEPCIKRS